MAVRSVLAFWAIAAILIVVPGPDWAFAISAGLRRHVVPAASGIALGYVVVTVVVATGLGILIASIPAALTVLTMAGGAYLVWLGVKTFRHPAATPSSSLEAPAGSRTSTLLQGMAVSGLNPKGLLVFLAVLPQFATPRGNWPLVVQLGVLGAVFTFTCAVFYLGMGSLARRILDGRPALSRVIARGSGAAMIVLGLLLLAEHLLV